MGETLLNAWLNALCALFQKIQSRVFRLAHQVHADIKIIHGLFLGVTYISEMCEGFLNAQKLSDREICKRNPAHKFFLWGYRLCCEKNHENRPNRFFIHMSTLRPCLNAWMTGVSLRVLKFKIREPLNCFERKVYN